jgi:hypothetical protein
MSNSKKSKTIPSPRDIATTSIAAWQQRQQETEAKRATLNTLEAARAFNGSTSEKRVERIDAEDAFIMAEEAERLARIAARDALDAAERSEGDPLAIACDAVRARDAVAHHAEKVARLERELHAEKQAVADLVVTTTGALAEVTRRRAAQGLPPPAGLPTMVDVLGRPRLPVAEVLALLEKRVEEGPPNPQCKVDRATPLRREKTQILADLERARREREEDEQRRSAHERWKTASDEADRKSEAERNAAAVEEHARKQREDEELAAAFLARTGT